MDNVDGAPQEETKQRPKSIERLNRRVLGVLIEKAKTTPDAYPLSLNALTTGCNQKSNRSPLMSLAPDQVEDILDRMRHGGAVAEVQGGGRVPKYRHYAKDYLGVEGAEVGVIAELLLRGPQTIGELRTRSSRMATIPDMESLRPILRSLHEKGLVLYLTPEGRGQIVTHNLYEPRELEKVHDQYANAPAPAPVQSSSPASAPVAHASPAAPVASGNSPAESEELAELRKEVASLRTEMADLRKDIEDLWSNLK